MRRSFPLLAGLAVLITSLVVHGSWTGRWQDSEVLEQAAAGLQRVPLSFGDWEGTSFELTFKARDQAGISGYAARRYTHRATGARLTLLIVCGRPGPISVHTPDVCYRGAGYQPVDPPARIAVKGARQDSPVPFWTATFAKAGVVTDQLRLHWTWYAGGSWNAPDHPRLTFAGQAVLYKMYVIREMNPGEKPDDEDPNLGFIQALLPELTGVFD